MRHYLEYTNDASSKFWEIILDGKSYSVRYGKIGSAGKTQIKKFLSEEEAKKEAEKLFRSKLSKGYSEKCSEFAGSSLTQKNTKTVKPGGKAKLLKGFQSVIPDIDFFRRQVTAAYGFVFPEDLFLFPVFCADLVNERIVKLDRSGDFISSVLIFFDEMFGVRLGRIFDPLSDNFDNSLYDPVAEDRFYNDPPEFFTVINGTSDGEHWGYWVDDPASGEFRLCSYCHADSYEFNDDGETIFDAFSVILERASEEGDSKIVKICNKVRGVLKNYQREAVVKREATVSFHDLGIKVLQEKYRRPRYPLYQVFVENYLENSVADAADIEALASECHLLCLEGFPGAAYAFGKRLWLEQGASRIIAESLLEEAFVALGRTPIFAALKKASAFRKKCDSSYQTLLTKEEFYLNLPIKRALLSIDVHPNNPLIIAGVEARIDEKENFLLGVFDYREKKFIKSFLPCEDRESALKVFYDSFGDRCVFVYRRGFYTQSAFELRMLDFTSGEVKTICDYPSAHIQHNLFPTGIAFLSSSNTLLVGTDRLCGYNLSDSARLMFERPFDNIPEGPVCLAASPDGREYAVGGVQKGIVKVYSAVNHALIDEYRGEWSAPLQIALDDAGKIIAILDESSFLSIGNDGGLYLFNRKEGMRIEESLCENFFKSYTPCFSMLPDASKILIGHNNGYLHMLKAASHSEGDGRSYEDVDRLHKTRISSVMPLSGGLVATVAGLRIAVRQIP